MEPGTPLGSPRETAQARALWTLAVLLLALGWRAHRATPDPRHPATPPRCHRWVQVGPPDAPLRCLSGRSLAPVGRAGLGRPCVTWLGRVGVSPGDRLVPALDHPAGCRRGRLPPALIATLNLPVPVNRAGPAELATLPGIGPALARRIVAERARGGPFRTPADLCRVRGIGPRLAARLRARLIF